MRHKRRTLFGHPVEQSFAAIYVLEQYLADCRPDCIIELGTGRGSLALYFSNYAKFAKATFLTYDIKKPDIEFTEFDTMDVYKDISIQHNCRKLNMFDRPFVYIDALDPKSELANLYLPHLKKGTVVACHDCILNSDKSFRWGFTEDSIKWKFTQRFEPYYSISKELDTRTLFLKKKERENDVRD